MKEQVQKCALVIRDASLDAYTELVLKPVLSICELPGSPRSLDWHNISEPMADILNYGMVASLI
jgi:hypothetical protein